MVERKAPAKKAPAKKAAAKTPKPAAEPDVDTPDQPEPADQGSDHPGFVGDLPDSTPNEDYTLSGVIKQLNQ